LHVAAATTTPTLVSIGGTNHGGVTTHVGSSEMEVVKEREEDKKTTLVESNAAQTLKRHPAAS
jgi:hypothetical protein